MELYNENDMHIFRTNIEETINKINEIVLNNYAPTKTETTDIQQIILQFAKEKKLKLYGGYGLHLAIKNVAPSGSFYKNDEIYSKDIDLYSPDPITDIISLSNILHEKGYSQVYAREATHLESYTLEVNKRPYCDFSYVPKNVYRRIPFITINGYIVVYPYFAMIDYLKMFIDPILAGSFRWEKSFERFFVLQKYYPIRTSKKSLVLDRKLPPKIYDNIVNDFIKKSKTLIATGYLAYNMYLSKSKIPKPYIRELQLPFIELVSIDYANDVNKILGSLVKTYGDSIKIIEYYPFFTFTGFKTEILHDGKLIVRIFENLPNLCFTYTTVNDILYGSFHYNLRMCIVNAIYARVNESQDTEKHFYDMASHLIQMRKYYFTGTDDTMFSDTVFKDFSVNCIGITQNDKIYRSITYDKRKQSFKYNPSGKKINTLIWTFSNSSGNKINNIKNYKIIMEPDVHVPPERKIDNENENEPKEDGDQSSPPTNEN